MEDIYSELEFYMTQCDMDFCPPPLFDLPPPPPPPWMDNPPSCNGDCSSGIAKVSSLNNVQEIFHSISIIVVSAFVIVLSLLFFAVLIWRRRVILLRKFGSRNSLPQSQSDVTSTSQKKSASDSAQNSRTLPNHYISDRQLVTDANGRSTMLIRSTPLTAANSPASTLMIGGMPFHIIQSKPEGLNNVQQVPQLFQQYVVQNPGNNVYPVYETIESDYNCSEKSGSMYSDNSSAGTGYTLQQLISNTSSSTAGPTLYSYNHAVQASQLSQLSQTGSLQQVNNYTYASADYNQQQQQQTGSDAAYAYATSQVGPQQQHQVNMNMLQQLQMQQQQQFYNPQQRLLLNQINQNRTGSIHNLVQSQAPNPVQLTRPTTLQHSNQAAPVLLRNLPASRRVKSFRHPTAAESEFTAINRQPPPLPLPPIPTSESVTPAIHASTISLKNPPDPKSSITQL